MSLEKIAVVSRVALSVILVCMIYVDTNSFSLALAVSLIFGFTEIHSYMQKHIFSRLPSEQDMADIRKATEDMKELKKHMNWE
ncbi:MAG: hypothetical protein JXR12_06355 [Neptunomonas phycophila]|uniref:hypothetical protein n=1 Tax=Neptunomonas phycophila TaxID=1572645 RepID=UPI003B8EA9F7